MVEKYQLSYPAVSDLARRAKRRIPHFAWEYLDSGTSEEHLIARNRRAFSDVTLYPRFMKGPLEPQLATALFGQDYAAPFGVAPVGLTGLMWPQAERHLASMAGRYRIPCGFSTVATDTPEVIGPLARGMGWFMLYPPRRKDMRRDLLKRAADSGFTTLLLTVDVPAPSGRERQRRARLAVPPRKDLVTLFRAAIRPQWTYETLRNGAPRFRMLEKYATASDMQQVSMFVTNELGGTLDWHYVAELREEWRGPIVLKGILHPDDAEEAIRLGIEGIGVSNHGARQFDGAPAAIEALPHVAERVAGRASIIFDSGVRTGLDIVRALALGADFVLLGRAYMFGVAALGAEGADHVTDILTGDLKSNMAQLGCATVGELRVIAAASPGR